MQFLNWESNGGSILKKSGIKGGGGKKWWVNQNIYNTGVALQIWRQMANDELIEKIDRWTQDREIRL